MKNAAFADPSFGTSIPRYSPPWSSGFAVAVAAAASVLAAVACSGSVESRDTKSGVNANGTGGGSNGAAGAAADSGADAAADPVQACEDYFRKVVEPCGLEGVSPVLSASDTAALLNLYRPSCAARLALPGTGFTPNAMLACVSKVASTSCTVAAQDPTCAFLGGTLPAGAPCLTAEQCEAGVCVAAAPGRASVPGTGLVSGGCGTCAAPDPAGRPCATSDGPGAPPGSMSISQAQCRVGEVCDVFKTGLCVPRGNRVGAPCISMTAGPQAPGCLPGLYCDEATLTCALQQEVGKGEACDGSLTVCAPHLVCTRDPTAVPVGPAGGPPPKTPVGMTCREPAPAGAACTGGDAECAPGLGCVGVCNSKSTEPCSCEVVTFVGPDEPCDSLARCRVGVCLAAGARCPRVIADGQPCDLNSALGPPGTHDVCEPFSSCIAGACTPGYPTCQ